jgi:phage FluMu protein Com
MNCGRCHTCGTALRSVLDGEERCPRCRTYRRYRSHGWAEAVDTEGCIRDVRQLGNIPVAVGSR